VMAGRSNVPKHRIGCGHPSVMATKEPFRPPGAHHPVALLTNDADLVTMGTLVLESWALDPALGLGDSVEAVKGRLPNRCLLLRYIESLPPEKAAELLTQVGSPIHGAATIHEVLADLPGSPMKWLANSGSKAPVRNDRPPLAVKVLARLQPSSRPPPVLISSILGRYLCPPGGDVTWPLRGARTQVLERSRSQLSRPP